MLAGASTPGYDYRADTVSRLGSSGQPLAVEVRAALVLYGLVVAAGATPIGRHAPGRERLLAVVFRACWGSAVYGLVERGLLVVAAGWVVALTSWTLAGRSVAL